MVELKKYQQKTVEIIKLFLNDMLKLDERRSKLAFISITNQPYKDQYFDEVPFICIKIPTGGGKTLVACHAMKDIMNIYLKEKLGKGLVLWFVPSEAIKTQTLNKLKDKKDSHRDILDRFFSNNIRVFSNEEALSIKKSDIENNLCIIIASLDAFRKEKTIQKKYKVYKDNGNLLSHFENFDDTTNLDKDERGTVIYSLANVIKLNNPLIVIDEGHRTKTPLSFDIIKKLNPSFLIEYTATPREESNILVEISAAELKDENMVKIPIYLDSLSQWQETVRRGVVRREELENLTKKDSDYIRPIALLQAEQEKESKDKIYVQKILDFLTKEMKIERDQIAVKTSKNNELGSVNLFSKKCPIRYIVTVNALGEGWDCSYAYVLISVANIGSRIAVEQIIGRIIRMPYAERRVIEDLNYSYVFASARNFNEAANYIVSGLENNGYSRKDLRNLSEKEVKEEVFKRQLKSNVEIPFISINDGEWRELEFGQDLIGPDFDLSKQDSEVDFKTHYDQDGRVKVDIGSEGKWIKERQTTLRISYKDKEFSETELVNWLDKKIRSKFLNPKEKRTYIKNVVELQLKKYSLVELSVNRFIFMDKIEDRINEIFINYAKKKFGKLLKEKQISLKTAFKPEDEIRLISAFEQKFKKHIFEKADKLNKEEEDLAFSLDALENVEWWYRNREKKDFYIQGWKMNKFYPDFVLKTKKGNLVVLEYKGEDRISNIDTEYKQELGEMWAYLGGNHCHFFLVSKKNKVNILKELEKL